MIKKTVTYQNIFTGQEVTKDLYFNLDPAELAKMWMVGGETWTEHLQTLSEKNDGKTIMEEFEKMLGTAYLERVGDDILKTPEIRERFLSSQAYNTLFMELITSDDNGASFFSGLVPSNVEEIIEKFKKSGAAAAKRPDDNTPAWIREGRKPTNAELQKMTKAELAEAFAAAQNN